jgi:hypothetical protein
MFEPNIRKNQMHANQLPFCHSNWPSAPDIRVAVMVATLFAAAASQAEVVNPTVAYELPPNSLIAVNFTGASISLRGLNAQADGSTRIENCAVTSDTASFFIPDTSFVFDATTTSARLQIRCTPPSFSNFILTVLNCTESENPGNNQVSTLRSWPLRCGNLVSDSFSRMAYAPNIGSTVRANGAAAIGASAESTISVRFVLGFASATLGSLSACQITGTNADDFGPPPGDIIVSTTAENASIAIQCERGEQPKIASLQCLETIGAQSTPRNWPLLCPAGEIESFTNGFEERAKASTK